MVLPLVAAGVMAGGALYNAYQNNQASKKAAAERARLQGLINAVQDPNFDTSQLMPEDLSIAERYSPELAQYIAEKNPQLVEDSQVAKQAQQARLQSLQGLQQLSQTGNDPIAELQRRRALRDAMMQSQTQRANIEQDAQRRGIGLGSGMSLAAQMQANAAANQTAALEGEQAAASAAGRRQQALGQVGSLGGQIYGDEDRRASMNADIINSFNQRVAQGMRQNQQYNIGNQNQAQQYNIGNQIAAKDKRFQAQQQNQQMRNQQAQQGFGNQMARLGQNVNMGQMNQQAIYGDAAQRSQAVSGLTNAAALGMTGYQDYSRNKAADARADEYLNLEKQRQADQYDLARNRGASGRVYAGSGYDPSKGYA